MPFLFAFFIINARNKSALKILIKGFFIENFLLKNRRKRWIICKK